MACDLLHFLFPGSVVVVAADKLLPLARSVNYFTMRDLQIRLYPNRVSIVRSSRAPSHKQRNIFIGDVARKSSFVIDRVSRRLRHDPHS